MSGGGTGLTSGDGLSMGSGGRVMSGEGFSCMTCCLCKNTSHYTSSPIARMSAIALLCSTTPLRIR